VSAVWRKPYVYPSKYVNYRFPPARRDCVEPEQGRNSRGPCRLAAATPDAGHRPVTPARPRKLSVLAITTSRDGGAALARESVADAPEFAGRHTDTPVRHNAVLETLAELGENSALLEVTSGRTPAVFATLAARSHVPRRLTAGR
jgi:hypothetical protein